MSAKQKKNLIRILAGAGLYIIYAVTFHLIEAPWYAALLASLVPYAVVGYDVVIKAIRGIGHGQVFDEQFLMVLATVGAYVVAEYSEAVAVMLFYQVGEWFQSYAVGRSRQSIAGLMDIYPEHANLEVDGVLQEVEPDEVEVGSLIVVKPGERIPLDGVVVEGSSQVDTSALTGESVPRVVRPGDTLISGCINSTDLLRVRTTKEFDDSTVAKILELVENSAEKKGRVESFITRFARYYTPIVVIAALFLAVVPPFFTGGLRNPGIWLDWIQRACIFLVISCPCALVISVPMSFFGGIGGASKNGILVKGSTYMELLARLDTVVFDKTGTLTQGSFQVAEVSPAGDTSREALLEVAALAESCSNHPIARSIQAAYGAQPDLTRISGAEEQAGRGVQAQVDGKPVLAGNLLLMQEAGIQAPPAPAAGTAVYVACEGRYWGYILIADRPKPDAKEAIARLKAAGVSQTVMLTGDRAEVAQAVAQELGIDQVYAQLLPADKVERVEGLLAAEPPQRKLAFVGDGINDAPVLTRADVGIAMGALGSDAAIEAADVVLMDDKPSKIPLAIAIAKKTVAIAHENIVFALAVKGVFLIMGALGVATMWEAVFADVGVAVLAILNAMRAMNTPKQS
ncbi:MAG: cadmium-translocating P-type ATPase [Oscillospiraceae bacterium]|nr:cadmium-translocating P-type ATPase [Oscillospiraceae bacterium]